MVYNIESIDSKNADAFKFKISQNSSTNSSSRPSLLTNSSLVSFDITYAALIGRKWKQRINELLIFNLYGSEATPTSFFGSDHFGMVLTIVWGVCVAVYKSHGHMW